MRLSDFSVYVRRLPSGRAYYYAKVRNPRTGKYRAGQSTQIEVPNGKLNQRQARIEAEAIARRWTEEQKAPALPARGDFIAFLEAFWDFDASTYVQGQVKRGKTISRRYCGIMLDMVHKYVEPTFKGWSIEALDAQAFDAWMAALSAKGTSARTINLARQSCNVPLNNLVRLRQLPWNPLSAARPYHEKYATRGILTVDELAEVVNLELDLRVRLAIQLGAYCGLRLGEIRGLRWSDVDDTTLHVRRSYVPVDGERDQAKHGSNRDVPLPSPVVETLTTWRVISPAHGDGDFIACSLRQPYSPMDDSTIRAAFQSALGKVGVKRPAQKERGLVFHGLRHWYVSQLRGTLPDHVLRALVGHKQASVTEAYSHVVSFEAARERIEAIAKPIAKISLDAS